MLFSEFTSFNRYLISYNMESHASLTPESSAALSWRDPVLLLISFLKYYVSTFGPCLVFWIIQPALFSRMTSRILCGLEIPIFSLVVNWSCTYVEGLKELFPFPLVILQFTFLRLTGCKAPDVPSLCDFPPPHLLISHLCSV